MENFDLPEKLSVQEVFDHFHASLKTMVLRVFVLLAYFLWFILCMYSQKYDNI